MRAFVCGDAFSHAILTWRPEINVGVYSTPPYFLETGSLTESGVSHLATQACQQASGIHTHHLLPSSVGLQAHTATSGFYRGTRDLNSGSHACRIGILFTEPSPLSPRQSLNTTTLLKLPNLFEILLPSMHSYKNQDVIQNVLASGTGEYKGQWSRH